MEQGNVFINDAPQATYEAEDLKEGLTGCDGAISVDVDGSKKGFDDIREEFRNIEAGEQSPRVGLAMSQGFGNGAAETTISRQASLLSGADHWCGVTHELPDVNGSGGLKVRKVFMLVGL